VKELASAISDYESYLSKQDLLLRRRTQNWETRLLEMLRDTLLEKARAAMADGDLSRWAAEVAENKRDPYSVIEEVAQKVIR
jgi:putative protein kinase ArgK-like GTPase of G3E family